MHPLNAELNPISDLLALLGGANIVVISRLRVNKIHYFLENLLVFSQTVVYMFQITPAG